MKRILQSVWSGLALAGLAAQSPVITSGSGGNPYRVVVASNIFDLKEPPTIVTNTLPPAQPAIIWLQGISDILHKKQVLLRIQEPPKPGEQPKERALIMDEGERRGSVTVLEINLSARTVKFDNAGMMQVLELTNAPTKLTDPVPRVSAMPLPTVAPTAVVPSRPQLTAEEQIILMEVERERTKDAVTKGEHPPLPPTELTPPGAPGSATPAPSGT